jgi:hypothetical protein
MCRNCHILMGANSAQNRPTTDLIPLSKKTKTWPCSDGVAMALSSDQTRHNSKLVLAYHPRLCFRGTPTFMGARQARTRLRKRFCCRGHRHRHSSAQRNLKDTHSKRKQGRLVWSLDCHEQNKRKPARGSPRWRLGPQPIHRPEWCASLLAVLAPGHISGWAPCTACQCGPASWFSPLCWPRLCWVYLSCRKSSLAAAEVPATARRA